MKKLFLSLLIVLWSTNTFACHMIQRCHQFTPYVECKIQYLESLPEVSPLLTQPISLAKITQLHEFNIVPFGSPPGGDYLPNCPINTPEPSTLANLFAGGLFLMFCGGIIWIRKKVIQ